MLKKIIALLLVVVMLFGVAACTNTDVTSKQEGTSSIDDEVSQDTSSKDDTSSDDKKTNSSKKEPTAITTTRTEKEDGIINLNIDNSKVFNSNWEGVNAINQGFIFLPDEFGRDYSDAQIAEELKRMDDMDINMVRSYMDAGYAFKSRKDKEITYDWNSERMQAFYKWLDAMEERDIEVAVQMGWTVASVAGGRTNDALGYTIPWYVKKEHEEYYNVYSEMIDMYTDWVELFIKEVIIKRGYDIEYLVMFTEPYHKDVTFTQSEYTFYYEAKEGATMTKHGWEVSVDLIQATHKALKEAGLRDKVKLTGPQYGLSNHFFEGETLEEEINWWIERIDDCIDVYTFHWYVPSWPGQYSASDDKQGSTEGASILDDNYDIWEYYFTEMVNIISKTGKPFWFDEWNYGANAIQIQVKDFYAQQVAQAVIAAMNTGVNNMIYWQMFETVWPTRMDGNARTDNKG